MSDDNIINFPPLVRTPSHATDALINNYWEIATDLMKQSARAALNAETMFIDLQRPHQIKTEQRPSLYRLPEWSAIDLLSFDPDPSSSNHVIGTGETAADAKLDLLDKLNGR